MIFVSIKNSILIKQLNPQHTREIHKTVNFLNFIFDINMSVGKGSNCKLTMERVETNGFNGAVFEVFQNKEDDGFLFMI